VSVRVGFAILPFELPARGSVVETGRFEEAARLLEIASASTWWQASTSARDPAGRLGAGVREVEEKIGL